MMQEQKGFALVLTLLILVVLSILVVGVYQNSILSILVSQNAGDQPIALGYASTCESNQAFGLLSGARGPTPFTIDPSTNALKVSCTSDAPNLVWRTSKSAGTNAEARYAVLRFRTTATGRRAAVANLITDIAIFDMKNQSSGN